MKKSELRHIIRKTIQEHFIKEDTPLISYGPDDPDPESLSFGSGGGGLVFTDDGLIPLDQYLQSQVAQTIFGVPSFDNVNQMYSDALSAEGDVEDNIGGLVGAAASGDLDVDSQQYINMVVDILVNYTNQLEDYYQFYDGDETNPGFEPGTFSGYENQQIPSDIGYYANIYQNTSPQALAAAAANTLENYCRMSPWYLEAVANGPGAAGEMIRSHMEEFANVEGGPFVVPFAWCPQSYFSCFPNCNDEPWNWYDMTQSEYCEGKFGGPAGNPNLSQESQPCQNSLYYSCMNIVLPTPILPTPTSGHGCMDPSAFNYNPDAEHPCVCVDASIDVGIFNAQPACPCNYDATLQLQTVDGDTIDDLPPPELTVKDPIKKDTSIGVTPPRPVSTLTPPKPKITPPTPINDPKKTRLQELAGIRKRK